MSICVYGITALEILRSSGRLLPDLLECPRTSSIDDCHATSVTELDDILPRLGARTKPYHLLVPGGASTYDYKNVCRHRAYAKLPRASLMKTERDILVPTPEFVFCQLAASGEFDELDLVLLGMELCGTYVLDTSPDSWKGFTNLPVSPTNQARIGRILAAYKGRYGVQLANAALPFLLDGSNSPMETSLAALLTLPTRRGGLGLSGAKLNHQVATNDGNRWIDIAFPEKMVGLEYKGRMYHGVEQSGRDDRRQNGLVGAGWTIINVWYEDLADEFLFQRLASSLAKSLGARLRIRADGFATKHAILRSKVIPGIKLTPQL